MRRALQSISRARAHVAVALVSTLLTGCLSKPSAEDVLATGFRTPEQTFATFRTALRGDLTDLEYRCLSTGFKRSQRISQLVYLKGRAELLEREPLFKLVARAEVIERTELAPDRVRLTARVDAFFTDRTFWIELVREEFWEAHGAGELLGDDYAEWDQLLREKDGMLVLTIPLPGGTALSEIDELRAGREWKIDAFRPVESP